MKKFKCFLGFHDWHIHDSNDSSDKNFFGNSVMIMASCAIFGTFSLSFKAYILASTSIFAISIILLVMGIVRWATLWKDASCLQCGKHVFQESQRKIKETEKRLLKEQQEEARKELVSLLTEQYYRKRLDSLDKYLEN